MSHDVYLMDKDNCVIHFDEAHQISGGTQTAGGSTEAWFNITFNYGLGGLLEKIEGMTAKESMPYLEGAELILSDEIDPDYWKPAPGNIKLAIKGLMALGKLAPEGIWKVSS